MILKNEFKKTSSFLSDKLIGASFTYFRVYKSTIELCFYIRENNSIEEVWLSGTDNINISNQHGRSENFKEILFALKCLIGETIRLIRVDIGKLFINIGNYELSITFEDDSVLEEIWAITPFTATPYANHDWYVALSDENEIILKLPEANN